MSGLRRGFHGDVRRSLTYPSPCRTLRLTGTDSQPPSCAPPARKRAAAVAKFADFADFLDFAGCFADKSCRHAQPGPSAKRLQPERNRKMRIRNAPALLMIAAVLCFSGCVCTHSSVCGPGVAPGVTACDPCGDCASGTCGHGYLAASAKSSLTCGSGCGDIYWGPWSDCPPDSCDPCGTYACDPCCSPWAPLKGLLHLWGYRYSPACGSCGGCDSCGVAGEMVVPGEYMEGTMMPAPMESYEMLAPPQPDPKSVKAASMKRPVRRVRNTPHLIR
jgi:hypothetical protein